LSGGQSEMIKRK